MAQQPRSGAGPLALGDGKSAPEGRNSRRAPGPEDVAPSGNCEGCVADGAQPGEAGAEEALGWPGLQQLPSMWSSFGG